MTLPEKKLFSMIFLDLCESCDLKFKLSFVNKKSNYSLPNSAFLCRLSKHSPMWLSDRIKKLLF